MTNSVWFWDQNFLPWVFIERAPWNVINVISSVNTDIVVQRSFIQHAILRASGETEQDPGGPGTNPFHVPCFLFVGNRLHSASLAFLEIQGQIQTVANQGGKGMQKQRRNRQEPLVQPPWGRVLVPPQGIYGTTYLGVLLQKLRLPPRWRTVTSGWTQIPVTSPPTYQKKFCTQ